MIHLQYSILLIVIPLLVAPLVALFNRGNLAWFLTLVVSVLGTIMSAQLLMDVSSGTVIHYELGGWAPPWGIEYRIDTLNALVSLIVSAIAAVTSLYARKSVEQEIPDHLIPLFYASFLLCYMGLLGITLTGDIFNLFVFLEISSLSTYALIALGSNRKALTASFHYLVLGTLGATFFLIGVGFLYSATGTLNMDELSTKLATTDNPQILLTAFAFIVVGMALKAAIYPLHLWLPNAYTYAPTVISIFLSATATKVAIYALLRCMFNVYSVDYVLSTGLPYVLVIFGGVAVLYGSLRAVLETGMKKMLAYSSVSQVGYMVMGIGFVSQLGLSASILHLFNHALMKAAFFMCAGLFIYRVNTATFENLRGMGKEMPWTFGAMLIAGLSLIGVPGTVGFVSKWQLIQAAIEQQQWMMVTIILVGSVLTIAYVWKLVEVLYFQTKEKIHVHNVESGTDRIAASPMSMVIATWITALACIYFGFDTTLPMEAAYGAVDLLLSTKGGN